MKVTNEIFLSFINCHYKAYRKWKSEIGEISDFEKAFNELKYFRKLLFSETVSSPFRRLNSKIRVVNFLPQT